MNLTIERLSTTLPRNLPYVLTKTVAALATSVSTSITSRLKNTFIHCTRALGLLMLFLAASSPSLAGDMEEVVVYGQSVPTGFYNWTSGMMSMPELRSLYQATGPGLYGGPSPFEQMKMQWQQRCGHMMANLFDEVEGCVTQTELHLDLMYDICDARASGRSVDYTVSITLPLIRGISAGGAITWTAPSHNYAHCANKAEGHQRTLEGKCVNSFHQARLKERICQGHSGWTSAAGFGK